MNPSYLYHAFGVRHHECTKTEFKGNQNIHYIPTRKDKLRCPECNSRHVIRSGYIFRDIRCVPVGHKNRLENAQEMNAPLMKGYYLKEALREIWMQVDKEQTEKVLCDWVRQAKDSKVPLLIKFANTLMAHRSGILAWYDYHISTAKLEGINNNIKTIKRQAYGYRDEKFLELKILAMHEKIYAFIG